MSDNLAHFNYEEADHSKSWSEKNVLDVFSKPNARTIKTSKYQVCDQVLFFCFVWNFKRTPSVGIFKQFFFVIDNAMQYEMYEKWKSEC